MTKHQVCLPAAFITFFPLTADPTTSSLRDNQLKTEIANIRGVFASTNYKTKVIVVLIGDEDGSALTDSEERVASIQKASGFDSKQFFFLPPGDRAPSPEALVRRILTYLQPSCIEYYRDLSKHTRRKRNRSHVPPPTAPPTVGTSQTLPLQGWNVRYEFKLGIFAEFRQEMEAAGRNYETAYDSLLAPELLETIPSWSPRFNEARLLADAIAVRNLRCLLWTHQTTTAVRFWLKHRARVKNFVDQRGKGSDDYGWQAWEAMWSKSVAQLLEQCTNFDQAEADESAQVAKQYVLPEKAVPTGSRIAPWELLHHGGYWFNRSWKNTHARRILAHQIPEEDRAKSAHSGTTAAANRSHLYDQYLAFEPYDEHPVDGRTGYDYSAEILTCLQSAAISFDRHHQPRFAEKLRLEQAKEHLTQQNFGAAHDIMCSFWPGLSWRQSGWWRMVADAAWTLRQSAIETADIKTLLRLEWEAHNSTFTSIPGWKYDFHRCLEPFQSPSDNINVNISSEESLSPVWASFHFASAELNVSEKLDGQIVLSSTAQSSSEPIRLSEIDIIFDGPLSPIRISAQKSDVSSLVKLCSKISVPLHEARPGEGLDDQNQSQAQISTLKGEADIALSPGQRIILAISCSPREAGEVKLHAIKLRTHMGICSFTYSIVRHGLVDRTRWSSVGGLPRKRLVGRDHDANTLRIFPKPPKLQILISGMEETYYTNETLSLPIRIRNEETESADASLEAVLRSPQEHTATVKWSDDSVTETATSRHDDMPLSTASMISLYPRSLGSIASNCERSLGLSIEHTTEALQHELEITARYHLSSEPHTKLSKRIAVSFRLVPPFQPTFRLMARLDDAAWPNFFDPSNLRSGLSQKFSLLVHLVSFVTSPMIIESMIARPGEVIGNVSCEIHEDEKQLAIDQLSLDAGPDDQHVATATSSTRTSSFAVSLQKKAFGDVRSVAVDIVLIVRWRREPGGDPITSTIEAPRFVVPMGEPRALLLHRRDGAQSIQSNTQIQTHSIIVHLQCTIENPSMHYLTFNLAMESSDEFAFSGPKATSFSLVPASRHTVHWQLLPIRPEARWLRVNVEVIDAYFSKSLRIVPADEGVKSDGKRGLLVSVVS